jgi:hypothetical protein
MTATYRTGYGTTRRTLDQLKAWSQFANLHPEVQRRVIALMDAARAAGTDLGVGNGFRSYDEQFRLFDSRHNIVASGGCCSFNNKRWEIVPGAKHAAPPYRSYHEGTVNIAGRLYGVALDVVGWENGWMERHLAAYGLRSFASLSGEMREPWHIQPVEFPTSRAQYNPLMHTLKPWALPEAPKPQTVVDVPDPTIRMGSTGTEVRELQMACKFWGWYPHTVDGVAGARTVEAIKKMQGTLRLSQDGVYGPVTAKAYQNFVTALANL